MARSFLDFFPAPDFLSMKSVGIAISNNAVRAVSFKHATGHEKIDQYIEQQLSPGTIVDAEISKTDDLLNAIRKAKGVTKAKFAKVSLPEEKAFLFELDIEVPEESTIREAIEFSLEENVPISPADAVFDFVVIPEENEGNKQHAVVSVFPKNAVDEYLAAFKQVGIRPTTFLPESQSVASSAVVSGDTRTYALIIVGKERGTIAIVKRGIVRFSSTFAIDDAGVAEQGDMKDSVRLVTIGEEVRKVVSYWHGARREKSSKIDSVLILGELSDRTSLDAYITEQVGIATKRPNVWQNIFSVESYVPSITLNDSLKYAAAVGAVIM